MRVICASALPRRRSPRPARNRPPASGVRIGIKSSIRGAITGFGVVSGAEDLLCHRVDVAQDAVHQNGSVPQRRAGIGLRKQHQPVDAEFRVSFDRSLVQRPGGGVVRVLAGGRRLGVEVG